MRFFLGIFCRVLSHLHFAIFSPTNLQIYPYQYIFLNLEPAKKTRVENGWWL